MVRGVLALDGVNVHAWTAADRVSVGYVLLHRRLRQSGDVDGLRELFELTGDRDSLAALDREIMGQPPQIETTR